MDKISTGSSYRTPGRNRNYKNYLEKMIEVVLPEQRDVYLQALETFNTKIIDDRDYKYIPHINQFRLNFDAFINELRYEYKRAKRDAKEAGRERYHERLCFLCERICQKYKWVNVDGSFVVTPKQLLRIKLHLNELLSAFIRYCSLHENMVGLEARLMKTRQCAWNSMQTAKTKEKCFMATIAPSLMYLASGGEIKILSTVMMLNDTGHESQIEKTMEWFRVVYGNVAISSVGKGAISIFEYESGLRSDLRKTTSKKTSRDMADDDFGFEVQFHKRIYRRGRGKTVEKWLRNTVMRCQVANIYSMVIVDETQNATNVRSVYHAFITKLMDPDAEVRGFETDPHDKESEELAKFLCSKEAELILHNNYIITLYFSATPFQHNQTKAVKTYGVIGLNHTGIHCLEGVYCKNSDGFYMNDPAVQSIQPRMISWESLYHDNGVSPGSISPSAYDREQSFLNQLDRLHNKHGLPRTITTHADYRLYCEQFYADCFEQLAVNHPKQEGLPYEFPELPAMFAGRLSRNNQVISEIMIPGIMRQLQNPEKFFLVPYNMETKRIPEFADKNKKFDLREFVELLAGRPEVEGKHIVVLLTAKGRCGDQFPNDFRVFLEYPGKNRDITVATQAFYGRACGYNKGETVVVLSEIHVEMIRIYIRLHGQIHGRTKVKGAKKHDWRFRVYRGSDFEHPPGDLMQEKVLDPVLHGLLKIIESHCISIMSTTKGCRGVSRARIPAAMLDNIIQHLREQGQQLCDIADTSQAFVVDDAATTLRRHSYVNPGSEVPDEIELDHGTLRMDAMGRTDTSGGTLSGGARVSSNLFTPTLVWFDEKLPDGSYRKHLAGIQLLCEGLYRRKNPSEAYAADIVAIPPDNRHPSWPAFDAQWRQQTRVVTDPKRSCFDDLDGSAIDIIVNPEA
jgi:hypothetical protein